jgi:SAM-dependent methyltransferase
MYTALASWWPLLSAPEDYAEEAELYGRLFVEAVRPRPRTILELGSGGGNNASHLKRHFELTLVDRSPAMLAVSRALNPECEHITGDMRSVRLGRLFDAVFVHDAVCYMTAEADLRAAIATAYVHCRPGGAALFCPDFVAETFRPGTDHGGHDGGQRGLRYLEWTWDPDPSDTSYLVDFAYLLRHEDGSVTAERDRHQFGLFSRAHWLRLLAEAGFVPEVRSASLGEVVGSELFLAIRGDGGPAPQRPGRVTGTVSRPAAPHISFSLDSPRLAAAASSDSYAQGRGQDRIGY